MHNLLIFLENKCFFFSVFFEKNIFLENPPGYHQHKNPQRSPDQVLFPFWNNTVFKEITTVITIIAETKTLMATKTDIYIKKHK